MVHAGADTREARISMEGFQINLILQKRSIMEPVPWTYDSGDIKLISKYLPRGWTEKFQGEIAYLNW